MFKPIRYQLLQNIALKLCGEIKPFCLEILDIPFKYLDIGNGEYEATLKCLHIWKDKSPVHTTAMLLDNIEKARSENQLDTHVEELFDGLSSDKLAGKLIIIFYTRKACPYHFRLYLFALR